MWKRVIWMADRMPQTISDVDTRYPDVEASRLAPAEPAMIIGGVILET